MGKPDGNQMSLLQTAIDDLLHGRKGDVLSSTPTGRGEFREVVLRGRTSRVFDKVTGIDVKLRRPAKKE